MNPAPAEEALRKRNPTDCENSPIYNVIRIRWRPRPKPPKCERETQYPIQLAQILLYHNDKNIQPFCRDKFVGSQKSSAISETVKPFSDFASAIIMLNRVAPHNKRSTEYNSRVFLLSIMRRNQRRAL
jgi:hypothetical protein